MTDVDVPPPAERGDRVAVVAPASGLGAAYPAVYRLGLERLRTFDLEPVEYPTATQDDDYLSDHPEARAADVERAFRDPDVGAVVAVIGGNDQLRIVEHLDTDVLAANPTRFLGVSDNTVLHAALADAGVASFYGGNLLTDFAGPDGIHDYTREALERAFFGEPAGPLLPAPEFTDDNPDWGRDDYRDLEREWEPNPGWDWRGGESAASGRTWGGCLEVVDLLLAADRFVPDDGPLVLCLETSEELPGAGFVRRALLAMGERGLLDRTAAVLVGRPMARSHRVDRPPEERAAYRERQYDAVAEVVAEYAPGAPVVCGLDFGHTAPTAVPPLGVRATVDPGAGTVEFG
ncbi:MAG: S66 peptidase family protein [Halobacteriales archaeon]